MAGFRLLDQTWLMVIIAGLAFGLAVVASLALLGRIFPGPEKPIRVLLGTARDSHRQSGEFNTVPDLILCIREALVESLKALIRLGWNINDVHEFTGHGFGGTRTALTEAVRRGHLEMIQILLDAGADPTITLEALELGGLKQ